MKIEKLPSGSYRVRKTINKRTYSLVFDHKPTQKEITDTLYSQYNKGGSTHKKTVLLCAREYIDNRTNVLSPSTIQGYNKLYRSISPELGNIKIQDVEQSDIDAEINRYAQDHAPKSIRNYHGFLSSVFEVYRNDFTLRTSLPQKKKYDGYLPDTEDIKRLLDASKNSKYHIAFQLGIMGLRRGEVAGINIDTDLKDNVLHIHQVLCESEQGWILKDVPKTEDSNREIVLPQALVDEIKAQGFIIDTTPKMIVHEMHKYLDQLGIPRFRFHDLRHYFASYLHSMGVPDKYIMAMGGWKSTYTMDGIYKEAMAEKTKQVKQEVADMLLPNF